MITTRKASALYVSILVTIRDLYDPLTTSLWTLCNYRVVCPLSIYSLSVSSDLVLSWLIIYCIKK